MGKPTILDIILRTIAHIGWKLFLFGSKMTEEEYFKAIQEDILVNNYKEIIKQIALRKAKA